MITFTILYNIGPAVEYTAARYGDAVAYAKRNANGRAVVLVY